MGNIEKRKSNGIARCASLTRMHLRCTYLYVTYAAVRAVCRCKHRFHNVTRARRLRAINSLRGAISNDEDINGGSPE